jgi:hypothetical protein
LPGLLEQSTCIDICLRGAVYIYRQYQLLAGAPAGPVNSPIGLSLGFPGYFAIAFLHDNRIFSITFAHNRSRRHYRVDGCTTATAANSMAPDDWRLLA